MDRFVKEFGFVIVVFIVLSLSVWYWIDRFSQVTEISRREQAIFEAKMDMGFNHDYQLKGTRLYVTVGDKELRLHYRGEVYE